MKSQVSYKFTYITFASNLLIIMHHLNLEPYVDCGRIAQLIMGFFSSMARPAMTWFFWSSAFLFFYNYSRELWLKKWKSRVFSLGVPYIIWNAVSALALLATNNEMMNKGLLSSLRMTFVFYNGTGCANGPLWYIFRLFTFLLISPVLYELITRIGKWFWAIFFLIVGFNVYFKVGHFDFMYLLPIYMLGAFCGTRGKSWIEAVMSSDDELGVSLKINQLVFNKLVWFLCFVCLVLGAIVSNLNDSYLFSIGYRYICIIFLLEIVSIWSVKKKPSHFCSGSGMYFYCAHHVVCGVVRKFVLFLHLNSVLLYCLQCLVVFSVLFFSWQLLDCRCPRILEILTGGRNKR